MQSWPSSCNRVLFEASALSEAPETDPKEDAAQTRQNPIQRLRSSIDWLNKNKKRFFWWWVGYQAIKGMLTLSLIWIPLALLWLGLSGD